MLISREVDIELIHSAFEFDADHLCAPVADRELSIFLRRAIVHAGQQNRLWHVAARSLAAKPMLTPREEQVVELVIAGVRRRDLAAAIGISESTLKWHIHSLLKKCDATNVAEVARRAMAVLQTSGRRE